MSLTSIFYKTALVTLVVLTGGIVSATTIQDQKIEDIGGKSMSLADYKGKVVLLVNIATKCGYTPQLKGLEALYQKHKDQGLVVVGIPSNDFGGQTPEDEKGVKKFCLLNYGVTFPLTSKTVVKGENKHPLIASLVKASSDAKEIGWNFEKFLIGKDGQLVQRYGSSVKPDDQNLEKQITTLLAK